MRRIVIMFAVVALALSFAVPAEAFFGPRARARRAARQEARMEARANLGCSGAATGPVRGLIRAVLPPYNGN